MGDSGSLKIQAVENACVIIDLYTYGKCMQNRSSEITLCIITNLYIQDKCMLNHGC